MRKQSGFTLIELVVVIVILGILAATALPRFIDLSGEAEEAALNGVLGALNSANNINYAADLAGSSAVIDTTGGCTLAVAESLLGDGSTDLSDSEYTIDSGDTSVDVGDTIVCVLASPSGDYTGNYAITGVD